MTTMPEALRLAVELDDTHTTHVARIAAAELRRLSAENKLLHERHHDDNVEYTRVLAQRDALLQALKLARESGCATVYANEDDECGERGCCGVVSYKPHAYDCWVMAAQAAIKSVEENK